jgi:DNA-binding PadR family transcriptional regulator
MTGAIHAAPGGRCFHRPRHGGFAEFFTAMMGPPHRGGHGPGGFGGPGFGGPPWGNVWYGRGRGRRARRGDIRSAVLLLLAEEPRNGYQLMQEVEDRSGGVWRPSPGAVYPALAQLEDEGLVRSVEHDGRRVFELTDEGRSHVEQHGERLGTPWEAVTTGVPEELHALRTAGQGLAVAVAQVAQSGTPEQLEQALNVLEDARRALYRLLAGDAPGGDAAE